MSRPLDSSARMSSLGLETSVLASLGKSGAEKDAHTLIQTVVQHNPYTLTNGTGRGIWSTAGCRSARALLSSTQRFCGTVVVENQAGMRDPEMHAQGQQVSLWREGPCGRG